MNCDPLVKINNVATFLLPITCVEILLFRLYKTVQTQTESKDAYVGLLKL